MKNWIITLLLVCFTYTTSFAQDSSAKAVFKWTVKANKLAEKKYELVFTTSAPQGMELYAPSQDLDGTASAELNLNDSSIVLESFTADNTKKLTPPSSISPYR